MGRKKNELEILTLPKDLLENSPAGTKATKVLESPGRLKSLAHSLATRLTDYWLRRVPISQLDQAMAVRLGKKPTKSEQARREAKAYNQGVQDTITKLKKRGYWL